MSPSKLSRLNLLYIAICIAGLIWQVSEISERYFLFAVSTTIKIEIPEKEEPKAVNICFNMNPFLDTFAIKIRNQLSVKQKFDLLPKPDEMIIDCREFEGCNNWSRSRFILNEYICYRFTPNTYDKVSASKEYFNPAYDDLSKAQVYSVNMNLSYLVEEEIIVHIVLSDRRYLPWNAFVFSENLIHTIETFQTFYVWSYHIEVNRLQFPYVENCIDYQELYGCIDFIDCFTQCTEDLAMEYNYSSPLKHQINESNDNPVLEIFKVRDRLNFYHEVFDNCSAKYPLYDCYTITSFSSTKKAKPIGYGPFQPEFIVRAQHSWSPSYQTQSNPQLVLVEYITYVMGAFGAWFGFSILGINPIKRKLEKKKRNDQDSISDKLSKKIKSIVLKEVFGLRRCYSSHESRLTRIEKQTEINK